MNRIEFEQNRETIFALAREMAAIKAGACKHCDHFNLSSYCRIHESAVPEEHQPTGCDVWEYDGVPF